MEIRWLTAFIDRPAASFDAAVRFWSTVTGSSLSPVRGEHGQFATLVPDHGDAYLRVQRVDDGPGGSHLDVHVDDTGVLAAAAITAGATEHARYDDVVVLRSPAGLPWCAVAHRGEAVRPMARTLEDGTGAHRLDQLSLDIPASRFDDECAFWSTLTGWELDPSPLPQFQRLRGSDDLPLQLLLQRRDDDDGPARAHVDVAAGPDPAPVVAHHVGLGAEHLESFEHWIAMADPAGLPYCLTRRRP